MILYQRAMGIAVFRIYFSLYQLDEKQCLCSVPVWLGRRVHHSGWTAAYLLPDPVQPGSVSVCRVLCLLSHCTVWGLRVQGTE